MTRRQINEQLAWLMEGETLEERQTRAKSLAQSNSVFLPYMRMAFIKSQKILGIPEGMPDTYKPEFDVPDGIAQTTAMQEYRRIKNFIEGGPILRLHPYKIEETWINLMEGLHWKEAKVLVAIKDQVLEREYPGLTEVMESLGMPVDVKLDPPRRGRKRTKKVATTPVE
jgi:hypothetical protein